MGAAQTSIFAYKSIQHELGDKQQIVYDAVKELSRATNEEIAHYLGWEINRVTGRVNELSKYGMLVPDGIAIGKSGRPAKVWVITDVNDRHLKDISEECGV